MNQDIQTVLEGMGFEEKKENLWIKEVSQGLAYWDFRKTPKGRFYISTLDGFLDSKEAKTLDEYTIVKKIIDKPVLKEDIKETSFTEDVAKTEKMIRASEDDIVRLINTVKLDMIAKVSSDGLGEGVLYHKLGKTKDGKDLGFEPSVWLIDMIRHDMGNIGVELVSDDVRKLIDIEDGKEYLVYHAVVKNIDRVTNVETLGSASEVIDFEEMDSRGREFAYTNAIRKAERNATEHLIGVPKQVIVEKAKEIMTEYKKKKR